MEESKYGDKNIARITCEKKIQILNVNYFLFWIINFELIHIFQIKFYSFFYYLKRFLKKERKVNFKGNFSFYFYYYSELLEFGLGLFLLPGLLTLLSYIV